MFATKENDNKVDSSSMGLLTKPIVAENSRNSGRQTSIVEAPVISGLKALFSIDFDDNDESK
jgi:hypothetical protein